MKKIMVILLFILIATSAFCGIGIGGTITYGPPWQNSEELNWGFGVGLALNMDILYLSPLFIQIWIDVNYFNWNNYSVNTGDDWVHEFFMFLPGIRVILPFTDSTYPSGIYIEGGGDFSLDFWTNDGPLVSDDNSDIDLMRGVVLGAGVTGALKLLLIRVGVQVHLIEKVHITFPMTVGMYIDY